ncbi:MAG: SAM-dependent chlorinase/fluorinase [Planctomycetaceae bacterium]
MPEIIALTTDFGTTGSYVAQMKGVILGVAPDVRIVDVTHAISPQDVAEGALLLAECVSAFPPGTIHVVVVDPGVGTTRRIVAAEIGDWRFVAPDNGVLSAVARRHDVRRVVELTDARWWRAAISSTFHGRDIMAPVAARWATGVDPIEFGRPVEGPLRCLAFVEPRTSGNAIVGQVARCDAFGNLITNVPGWWFAKDAEQVIVTVRGRTLSGLCRTYGDVPPGEPLALVGSHGFVEIAVNQGDARAVLEARVGSEVRIERGTRADDMGTRA